jgi:hypothetical protein
MVLLKMGASALVLIPAHGCDARYNKISDNVLCGGAQNFSLSPATVTAWGSEMRNNTAVAVCPTEWPPS